MSDDDAVLDSNNNGDDDNDEAWVNNPANLPNPDSGCSTRKQASCYAKYTVLPYWPNLCVKCVYTIPKEMWTYFEMPWGKEIVAINVCIMFLSSG